MTLTADSSGYVKIFTGKLDGVKASMEGKLKLASDLNLAMKLTQEWFWLDFPFPFRDHYFSIQYQVNLWLDKILMEIRFHLTSHV